MSFSTHRCAEGRAHRSRLIATTKSLLVFAAMTAPLIATAQTIVPNGNLDSGLAPWSAFISASPDPVGSGAVPTWTATPDLLGNPASGSARIGIATTTPATNAASGFFQCVNLVAPTSVNFINYGISFWVPTTTVRDSSVSATAEIRLYSFAGCSGFFLGGATQAQSLTAANVQPETWYSVGDTGFVPPAAPVVVASVLVRGYLRQTGATPTQGAYAIQLDRSLLVLNDTTPVELMQFSVE